LEKEFSKQPNAEFTKSIGDPLKRSAMLFSQLLLISLPLSTPHRCGLPLYTALSGRTKLLGVVS